MKNFILTSILNILLFSAALGVPARRCIAQSFWEHHNLATGQFTQVSIAAADSEDFVIAGWLGTQYVLRSQDGGSTWNYLFGGFHSAGIVHPSKNLIILGADSSFDIEVHNGNNITIRTISVGFIARSTDGGATWNWTRIGSGDTNKPQNPIGSIAALDSNHIFIPVAGDHYLVSADGGASWQSTTCPVRQHYSIGAGRGFNNPISAYPASNTLVVAEFDTAYDYTYGYKIYRSTDLGSTWSPGFQTTHNITKFTFVSPNVGFASGFISDATSNAASATIDKTTDGGLTWFNIYTYRFPGAPELLGIAFADSMNGFAVGRGGILIRTRDGGNTWTQDSSDISAGDVSTLSDIAFPTPTSAIIVSESGEALVFKPQGILSMPVITYPLYSTISTPSSFDVTWNAVPGAESYWLHVTVPGPDTIVVRDSNITATSYHLSNLSAGNQGGLEYELKVQARSHASNSNIADRLFIVYGAPSSVTDLPGGPIWQYLYVQNYPNPAQGHFHVRLSGIYSNPGARLTAEMMDLLGRKVMDLSDAANKGSNGSYSDFEVDARFLPGGVYSVRYTLGAYSSRGMVVIER